VSSWWCCQNANLSILGGFYVVVHYPMLSWQNWKLWLEHAICYGIEILFHRIIIENNDSSWEWTWNNLIINCALEIKIIRHSREANNLVDEQFKSFIILYYVLNAYWYDEDVLYFTPYSFGVTSRLFKIEFPLTFWIFVEFLVTKIFQFSMSPTS
jgi:uncharacterized membrane protein